MPSYAPAEQAGVHNKPAAAADQLTGGRRAAASGQAAADPDSGAGPLHRSPRSQSLLQMQQALDAGPNIRQQAALQRVLDDRPRTTALQKKGAAIDDNARLDSGQIARGAIQRKLIYRAEDKEDDAESLEKEFGNPKTSESQLVNKTERLQIPDLAQKLGQDLAPYKQGEPPDLKGQDLNYVVGHVVNEPTIWEDVSPDEMAEDFGKGDIKSPSTIKLIGCKSGQKFAPELAGELKKQSKDVTVLATTGVVHATAEGIASYAPAIGKEASKAQGFTGAINTRSKAAFNAIEKRRAELFKTVAGLRARFGKAAGSDRDAILQEFKNEVKLYFDWAVNQANSSRDKSDPFATTQDEGWQKYVAGEAAQGVTAAEALFGIPKKDAPAATLTADSATGNASTSTNPSTTSSTSSTSSTSTSSTAGQQITELISNTGGDDMIGPSAQQATTGGAPIQQKGVAQRENGGTAETRSGPRPTAENPNNTGLPDGLKAGVEQLSGLAMDDVRVHYNSPKPATVQAHAYTQGAEIHVAPGQERHLPHEAWHVVQQKQGRVKPTLQLKGVAISDDARLEREADVMGARAATGGNAEASQSNIAEREQLHRSSGESRDIAIQRKIVARIRTKKSGDWREISEVRLEGRAPTNVKGSAQGDHTVAETLINESVRRETLNQRPKVALNNIMHLARITLPPDSIDTLASKFDEWWGEFDNLDGEDQNARLEDFIQDYIELANKRPDTAFLREKEITRGGGGERQAIGLVRHLADKLEKGEAVQKGDLVQTAGGILGLIDIKYIAGEEERYTELICRALYHAVLSVFPQLNRNHVQVLVESLITMLGVRDNIPFKGQSSLWNAVAGRLGLSGATDSKMGGDDSKNTGSGGFNNNFSSNNATNISNNNNTNYDRDDDARMG